jgi:hypothetical protein
MLSTSMHQVQQQAHLDHFFSGLGNMAKRTAEHQLTKDDDDAGSGTEVSRFWLSAGLVCSDLFHSTNSPSSLVLERLVHLQSARESTSTGLQ